MRADPRSLVRRLNPTCTKILESVVERAAGGRYYEITVEHMLLGLCELEDGDVGHVLHFFRKDRLKLAASLEKSLQALRTGNAGRPVFSEKLFAWFEDTWVAASLERGATQMRGADLLLQFLERTGYYSAEEFPILEEIDVNEFKKSFDAMIAASKETVEMAPPSEPGQARQAGSAPGREALDRFTISFTDKAKKGEIDPIFGRDREIRQMIDILGRRRKNNPIVVGEPGVGKTALVEGLARAIANKEVPAELAQVELLSLDMGLLKAGAGVRGEMENRLKRVIAEVKGSPTPIIVFIDEAHTLVGGGGGGDNDIPNLLKPALARGEFRTIAATTWSEYKKYFEKDAALERRFQPVQVGEPTVDDAKVMVRGIRPTYENAHNAVIRDDAVEAAVELSDRYISGRLLPDKAVDLLDTAAARVRIEQDAPPPALVKLRSEKASLERELAARTRDIDDAAAESDSAERVAEIRERVTELEGEITALEARLTAEREAITALREATTKLRESEGDAKTKQLEVVGTARAKLREVQGEEPLVHYEVDRDAVAQVVADWTGIPVGKMRSSSIEVMLRLESLLQERIKGQDHATEAVAEAIRMSQAGVRAPQTPVAVMLFVGPSGVGKTETALALADLLYGGERSMVTINMSEFQEKHTVSRLIGSPPGYVGYGEGGVLTEAVRQRPYSVVLLDECEKADLEVMNLFYQVFDKGMLSDGEGKIINFRNTVVILTSNLATDVIMSLHENGAKPSMQEVVDAVRPTLSKHFKPALLARMSIVPYRPMDPSILTDIAKLKLRSLGRRLEEAHGMETLFADSLIQEMVSRCTESETGARALDHALRGSLMPVLAKAILERMAIGEMPPKLTIGLGFGGHWNFDFDGGAPDGGAAAEPEAEVAEPAPVDTSESV
ncbi:type VI secretion system ATPase TssH [Paraliomyxa miuraensis]|uniref:type VI secretion system ATPase TssH n=1 Tax=Paraliomyxa miuraensis TaxID=376150 RepID=UPI0022543AED|nr:type VI secretion system ATPase TssH [Paraliomyxa miuraensis]MCX4243019.1 type VI secretion system ATPase TssH [Paraliomyxa miuraensis]